MERNISTLTAYKSQEKKSCFYQNKNNLSKFVGCDRENGSYHGQDHQLTLMYLPIVHVLCSQVCACTPVGNEP